jgi:hypothetical protein
MIILSILQIFNTVIQVKTFGTSSMMTNNSMLCWQAKSRISKASLILGKNQHLSTYIYYGTCLAFLANIFK